MIQLNTNRSNIVCHALLNSTIHEYDILLVTEPWYGDIGNGTKGPVSLAGWQPILPLPSVPANVIPRAMAYIKNRPDFTVTLRSDLAMDADIQILQINQGTHTPTIIVNMYNQKAGEDPLNWSSDRLFNIELPNGMPVIISGDMNLHHPMWSNTAENPNPRAEAFVDWLTDQGLSC